MWLPRLTMLQIRSGITPTPCCAIPCSRAAFNRSRPYKAGAVGLALWFFVGVHHSHRIKLTGEIPRIAAFNRKLVYPALQGDGLILLIRRTGCRYLGSIEQCFHWKTFALL